MDIMPTSSKNQVFLMNSNTIMKKEVIIFIRNDVNI